MPLRWSAKYLDAAAPLAEIFWQAYTTLKPEEQRSLGETHSHSAGSRVKQPYGKAERLR